LAPRGRRRETLLLGIKLILKLLIDLLLAPSRITSRLAIGRSVRKPTCLSAGAAKTPRAIPGRSSAGRSTTPRRVLPQPLRKWRFLQLKVKIHWSFCCAVIDIFFERFESEHFDSHAPGSSRKRRKNIMAVFIGDGGKRLSALSDADRCSRNRLIAGFDKAALRKKRFPCSAEE